MAIFFKQKQSSVQIQPQKPNGKNTTQEVSKMIVSTELFRPNKKSRKTPCKASDKNCKKKQNGKEGRSSLQAYETRDALKHSAKGIKVYRKKIKGLKIK